MGVEKRLLSVKEVFRLAQQPHQNRAKLVRALSRTYGLIQEYVEEAKQSFVIKIYAALLHDRSKSKTRET